MKVMKIGPAAMCICLLVSCNNKHDPRTITESVLAEGMRIVVHAQSETLTIEGKKGFTRTYIGKEWSKTSVLIPRTTRWEGSLGLYDPAGSNTLGDRLVVDEGLQFFVNESEALRYLQTLSGYYDQIFYNNHGLVIAYKLISIPNEKPTRSLSIWQFYINNHRPNSMNGAVDNRIEMSGGTIADSAVPIQAPIGYERVLAGKEYNPATR